MIDSIINLFKWIWKSCTCKSKCVNNCQSDECFCGCNEPKEKAIKEIKSESLKETK